MEDELGIMVLEMRDEVNRKQAVKLLEHVKAERAKYKWKIVQINKYTWKEVRVC